MSQPTPQDVHIDAALTDFSIAYIQDPGNFIASQVFPMKPVSFMSNKYFIFNKNDWLRDDAFEKRAPGAAAPRSGFTLANDTYDCNPEWGEVPMSDMVLRNADPSLRLDEAATRLVTQRGLIRFDKQFVNAAFQFGTWDNNFDSNGVFGTAYTPWNDYSSDPVRDIDTAQEAVLQNTGKEPNCLTVGYRVHKALKRHPIVKDMYKYVSSESITEDMLAQALEVDKYVVAKASYATNIEGGPAAYQFIAGNNAMLTWMDGSPSIMEPCAGATFCWTNLTGISTAGVAIDQYYDQKVKDDIVRGQIAFDVKVTGKDLGAFFGNAVVTTP